MINFFTLEKIQPLLLEISKQAVYQKKAVVCGKKKKKNKLVEDYTRFYYKSDNQKSKLLYVPLDFVYLRSQKLPNLSVAFPSQRDDYKKKYKKLENNSLTNLFNSSQKQIRFLRPMKGGFIVLWKGLLGFFPKKRALFGFKNQLSFRKLLLSEKKYVNSKAWVDGTSLFLHFQKIKYNFSKTKKRQPNFAELMFTFSDQKYEKNRKTAKTENN